MECSPVIVNLIIPVLNSESYLDDFINRVSVVLRASPDITFRAVFVDDGSTDNTVQKLFELKQVHPYISVLVLSRNFGQTNAIIAGMESFPAEACIVMAADMQEPVDLITEFIKYWKEGYKICIAYRKYRSDHFWSRLFSKIFYFLIRIDVPQLPAGGFDYGLIDRVVVNHLLGKPHINRFIQGDVMELGFPIHYIPCTRISGKRTKFIQLFSRFKFKYFFDGFINTTRVPYRVLFIFNVFIFFGSLLSVIYHFLQSLYSQEPLWENVRNSVMFFFICLTLLLVNIVLEFIIRIYDILYRKSGYIIKNKVD